MIDYTWVKGRYKGDSARYIKGLIDTGIGYFQLEMGQEGRQTYIDVAFPFIPDEDGIPEHLIEITNQFQIDKLEKKTAAKNCPGQKFFEK
jgi:hypothetical protein